MNQANERTIFLEAIDQDSAQAMYAYVEQACAGNHDLQQRVEKLVAAHLKSEGKMANNLDEWFNEAIHFLNEDNVPEARKFLAKMKSTAPNDSRTLEIEGDCAKAEGDFELATQHYRKLINGSDSQAAARGNLSLGFLLMERGDRQDALKALIAAAPFLDNRESPYEHMNAMSSIAALEYELGDFAQSAQTLLGVLEKYEEYELDDDCSLIYLSCATQRGDALRSLGKLDEAQEAYQIVADITEELEIMDEHANACLLYTS